MLLAGRYARNRRQLFGDLVIVIFLTAQVFDGAFTYVGLKVFGPGIEANPFVGWLIHLLGPGAALTSAKAAAIGFGAFLHISSVHGAVAALTGLYLLLAVAPWTYVLLFAH